MLIDHISRYVTDPAQGSFDDLALAAALQILPAGRGAGVVTSWRDVLPAPADPATPRGEEVASGAELFRQVVDATIRRFCLPASGAPLPVLTLVPPSPAASSSLSDWADQVLARYGSPASAAACGPRGVETTRARSWAGGRQREGRPVLVLAAAAALGQWLDLLVRQDLRFRLPAGSALVEVVANGGAGEARGERLGRLHERLGLPAPAVVQVYQPAGQTSWCCTRALAGGDPDLLIAPPWVRVRALDPRTLAETAPGTPGRLAVFDLANVASNLPVHLLTDDLGVVHGKAGESGDDGFRLLGREGGQEGQGE